uniref:Uncharacterized protein n=1 Tax=Anguilla anguilla TaxID=7936 RepID=A0A0E9WCW9_ANGAN
MIGLLRFTCSLIKKVNIRLLKNGLKHRRENNWRQTGSPTQLPQSKLKWIGCEMSAIKVIRNKQE